jgi:hypothetical protein
MSNSDLKEPPSIMLRLGLVLFAFMIAVVGSLVMAWCMSRTYGWFVARDLGPGPSLSGWYGIAVLVHIALMTPLANLAREKAEDAPTSSVLLTVVGLSLASLIVTGSSYLTGLICGWI